MNLPRLREELWRNTLSSDDVTRNMENPGKLCKCWMVNVAFGGVMSSGISVRVVILLYIPANGTVKRDVIAK